MDFFKRINSWLEAFDELEKLPKVVVFLYSVLIVGLLLVALSPEMLELVEYQTAIQRVKFGSRWFYGVSSTAGAVALLLLLYVMARHATSGRDKASSYLIYSPRTFADELHLNQLGSGRGSWGQRALYVGVDGARSWLAVSLHPEYDIAEGKLRPALEKIIEHLGRVGSLISLGPGDGKVDSALMASLVATKGKGTAYVPIDISEGLLLVTMKRLKNELADVRMPFGILGDFEYGWDDFGHLIESEKHPRLFSILGNTVSNFDHGLEAFFPKIWGSVAEGDYVLFDILLGDFNDLLGPHSEQPARHDPNRLFPDTEVMRRYKEFIAQGARRISRDHRVFDDAAQSFATTLAVERKMSTDQGYDQLHLLYRDGGETRTIFKWRRYLKDMTAFQNWLRTALSGCTVVTTSDVTDDGKTTRLILLRRDPVPKKAAA